MTSLPGEYYLCSPFFTGLIRVDKLIEAITISSFDCYGTLLDFYFVAILTRQQKE